MRSRHLFLLVYSLGCCLGISSTQRNATCTAEGTCGQAPDPTSSFLQCVGLQSTDTGKDHMRRLKGTLQATMDVYTFMRSSMKGVPLLSLEGAVDANLIVDPLQNEDLVQMWLEVQIKPLLKSISKHFLTCLSTKNFSCSTYQTVVRGLSDYYSEMDPVRQKWIYTFFMYPFLSGDRVAGCLSPQGGSEDWLLKNFGSFSVEARIKDFLSLNVNFSGLDVLHLLTGAQKAQLLLNPELAGLDNATMTTVFHSLLTGGYSNTTSPGGPDNGTSPGFLPTTSLQPTYNPYLPASPQNSLKEVVNGFMAAFRPVGSFVHEFVSFTQTRNVSEIKSTNLAQFLLNWTLAELADMYKPHNTSVVPEVPTFDPTNFEDWYKQVVTPVLLRFLPNEAALMHQNITLAFKELFFLEKGDDSGTFEIQDVCSLTLDKSPCGLTNTVENLAYVLHCAASSNLKVTEATTLRLIVELTKRLNTLIVELKANFSEAVSDFQQIFAEVDSPLTEQHMDDPDFIKLWFRIKLMPLLPDVPPALLSCLSTKNFSCPVYQTIVRALSEQMRLMGADPGYSLNIYKYFIYSFLQHYNPSDAQCFTSANHSTEWLENNFGFFSRFASITDFYKLNPNFSGLDVLHLLTPNQTAEMLLVPLPAPPAKNVVIDRVFDFLVQFPEMLPEVLNSLVELALKVNPPCDIYKQILGRLYGAIASLPPDIEPFVWTGIDGLKNLAPAGCVPLNMTCHQTLYNATSICRGINSSELQSHLNTSVNVSCSFPLETYACAQLQGFTANQLVSLLQCDLPGNSSHSKVLWKMLLSRVSSVLDPALDILSNTPMTMIGPSASEVLDAIGEMRLSLLTDEQLKDSAVIGQWFSGRLSRFLPRASGSFLSCLSSRNLSCHTYQQILQVFVLHFDNMTLKQQDLVLKDFILSFLQQPSSGPGCVNGSSIDWLTKNLGPFSLVLSLRELLLINPRLNVLEVLPLLTPKQSAELLVMNDPALPDKDVLLPQGNLSCASYKLLFSRLDLAMATVSMDVLSSIADSKLNISQYIPPGCSIYGGQCNATVINETAICAGVNSTRLQLYLNNGLTNGHVCDFAVGQFACASLSALTARDLAEVIKCNRSSNSSGSRPAWVLLLTKASSPVLDGALGLLSNQTLDPRNPAVSVILDTIQELQLDGFSMANIHAPSLIDQWFKVKLRPFLPAVSPDFLSCLITTGLNCGTYQQIVQILSRVQPEMTLASQVSVYTHFMKPFLTSNKTADPSCSSNTTNSSDWMQKNLGGFAVIVPFQDLQILYPKFSPMDVLSQLSNRQLATLAATPGQLTSPAQVNMIMNLIPSALLPAFFDDFSSAIMGHQSTVPSAVRSTMLQVVFDRANLSSNSVNDSDVSLWLRNRLPPLLINLSPVQVAPFFAILAGRSCSIGQQGIGDLNSVITSLSDDTKKLIYNNIVQTLGGPAPLRCYGGNNNTSFYSFLRLYFMGFQFPNLTTFMSLIPPDRTYQLVNSMSPSDLGALLRQPGAVDNRAQLCVLYSNYVQTRAFLATESLPADVEQATLPCVWPTALSSSTKSDVNAWFDQSLKNYLVFLTKSLISPSVTYNASCLAFQKLVSVMNGYNYTAADFGRADVFGSIRAYLTSETVPRCYDPNNPDLNSTAWFAQYIGGFLPFLTLDDLQRFGSTQVIQVQDSNFNPLLLPLSCQCVAPGPAYTQLTAQQSLTVLQNLNSCTDLDPQISAALVSNLGTNIGLAALVALGNDSTSMSTGQIKGISPKDLQNALSTLSTVEGWSEGQARAIVQALLSSGVMQISTNSDLIKLGTLVMGLPATVFRSISGSQLISASTNPSFLVNLMSSPQIIQQVFVTQIVSVNTNSEMIIQNVPDPVATEIPRPLLLGFSGSSNDVITLNRKTWKEEQVELFFNLIAVENATAVLGGPNNLSSSLLQGFTCTGVRAVQKPQIKRLIQACRRSGKNKVRLVETQLTCMYNSIKGDPTATSFDLYPPDVLLYYDYSLVPQASCRSYFEQLGAADFTVFSAALSYKLTALFANAMRCLGITNTSLTKDNVAVLGNMCCTLDGPYIQNSDPSILETVKNCPGLTSSQVAAVQTVLLSGKTQYGAPSTWNLQTLKNLGMSPLYLTSTFYKNFDTSTKQQFLGYFLVVLKNNGVGPQLRGSMKQQIRLSINSKSKRAIDNSCTVGNITQVTISDSTFPFSYVDLNQFNYCLSPSTVRDNLDAITAKVDQADYLQIVLNKLQEAYGANSMIPEYQVQLLGPASRVATVDNINTWTVTQIDTLAALMDSSNGPWDPSLAKAIISKYLSTAGNQLGSAELNAIGGANLCALDVDVLKNISQQSLKNAGALNVTKCTAEKQTVLFSIAVQAFSPSTRAAPPVSSYQLTKPYIGGADLNYIRSLVGSDVNMDLSTFVSLNPNIVLNLTVSEVQNLLGNNVADLKSYENQTLVRSWISSQYQSQLDALQIGLVGGRASPTSTDTPATTTSSSTTSSSSSATTATTKPGSSSTTTTGKGAHIRADAGLSLLVLLLLLVTSQHLV
ncbi:hypothetical protein Q5P01_025517 [Channa striata]|uniref:Mesothelin-like protein n=1 Tax=Channa striata TaxID=64152 RepID=A0AA88INE9_CHASR|nr:hypothetical protein Q5P01_025517 [Channa striata]